MYKVNDREFNNATEALDYYISNFDFGNAILSINKPTAVKHQIIFTDAKGLKSSKQKFSSLNNIPLEITNKETHACHEIEKLLNVLSTKIEDFKKDELNIVKEAKTSTSDLQFKPIEITKPNINPVDDDPILKSLSKFESLNRQLSSTNLFERIDSSLNFNPIESTTLHALSINNNDIKNENFLQ